MESVSKAGFGFVSFSSEIEATLTLSNLTLNKEDSYCFAFGPDDTLDMRCSYPTTYSVNAYFKPFIKKSGVYTLPFLQAIAIECSKVKLDLFLKTEESGFLVKDCDNNSLHGDVLSQKMELEVEGGWIAVENVGDRDITVQVEIL